MFRTIKPALIIFALFTILTGMVYPLLITVAAQLLFPWQANGSLIFTANGGLVGSELIGQSFSEPQYFWGRLSDTADHPYNASASGSTNYSVMNEDLQEQVKARIAALHAVDPNNTASVPVDLVTASASGLDPHISLAAAFFQVSRVARTRGLTEDKVRSIVEQHIKAPLLGIIGEPRVSVLLLNLALDSIQ
jgi:K+-transporting ATPase ATPase C chain